MTHEAMIAFVKASQGLGETSDVSLTPLSARGSDRSFYRAAWKPEKTGILIHYDPIRTENAYYAEITEFLEGAGVRVPRLMGHDADRCLLLMEDLGSIDLWSFRNEPWEKRRELYVKTLAVVDRLHSSPEKNFPRHRVRLMEGFGPALYQWERGYFKEHFVAGALDITMEPAFEADLEKELQALAERLMGSTRCLVHRDLQSQNVMVRHGLPFLIDYQGMRFGSPFYDLGSFLNDPYVDLSVEEREELLFVYYGLRKREYDRDAFKALFWDASAERLMQALGAYGFLGYKKGLTSFLSHIDAGLANLYEAAGSARSLPLLTELAASCREKWRARGDHP